MVWKCQNEISPIFYYGISEKTNEKDLKIPNIQPPDWKNPYWMSLYISFNPVNKVRTDKIATVFFCISPSCHVIGCQPQDQYLYSLIAS